MSSLSQRASSAGTRLFLTIIGGAFKQKVDEGTEGAKRRDYETSDGATGTKYEIEHRNLTGNITNIDFEDSPYGNVLKVIITHESGEAAQFQCASDSRYAIDFMKKLPALDLSKEVVINPYDFEDKNGKRRTAFNIVQGGNKIYSAYWDNEKKVALLGIPQANADDMDDKDDWKMFFMTEKKFLIKATKKIAEGIAAQQPVESTTVEKDQEEDVPF